MDMIGVVLQSCSVRIIFEVNSGFGFACQLALCWFWRRYLEWAEVKWEYSIVSGRRGLDSSAVYQIANVRSLGQQSILYLAGVCGIWIYCVEACKGLSSGVLGKTLQ